MSLSREQFNQLKEIPLYKSKVISDSMAPLINIGDEVVIDVGNTSIKRFDIVVIYHGEKLICHYVWNVNKIVTPVLLQTRNMSGKLDLPVSFDDYLGKVMSHKLSLWHKLKIIF